MQSFDGEDSDGLDVEWDGAYVYVRAQFNGQGWGECAGPIENLTEESLRNAIARSLQAARKTPAYGAARARQHLMKEIPHGNERRSTRSI